MEILRIEEGELTLVHGERDHRVPAGNTVSFDASFAHAYRNAGERTVLMTMVVSVPPPR
ncbi:cupin domain-containing protein [Kitasatospora aureofaciens]|uniref:cupin domain-containing protein n=1 Tax=Kitasatospora aureofaciens TaxID=1894 RepID=UPI0027E16A87|nr:cupin domain-containing protein [Kitasatospora aureofaciens]